MSKTYQHLGSYSDLVATVKRSQPLFPLAQPGPETQRLVRQSLAFAPGPETPRAVKIERRWERDGIAGEAVSWSVGYGPRTEAWLLRPSGVRGPLPGIVALHDHGGFKFYGKEKIADGPTPTPQVLRSYREFYYGDRAFANALARQGYAVLVPDTFLWGSRKFPLEAMPEFDRKVGSGIQSDWSPPDTPEEIARYNSSAVIHENTIAKYCTALGTTLAGIVSFEDRVAVSYLAGRKDVQAESIGCIGLSGGGLRSALLQATDERIRAAVIVGLMTTYEGVLDHNIANHTWMLYPSEWSRYGDWADLAACRAPSPLLVQYDVDDGLFTIEGMKAAHRRLAAHYRSVGAPANYIGQFYPGPHKFDLQMQEAAFQWLAKQLRPSK